MAIKKQVKVKAKAKPRTKTKRTPAPAKTKPRTKTKIPPPSAEPAPKISRLKRDLAYTKHHSNFMDSHPKSKQIMQALLKGIPQRQIQQTFSKPPHTFTQPALSKYWNRHLRPAIELASSVNDPTSVQHVVHDNLRWIFDQVKEGAAKSLAKKRIFQSAETVYETDINDPDFAAHQVYLERALDTAERFADIAGINQTVNRQIGVQLAGVNQGVSVPGPGGSAQNMNLQMAIAMPRNPMVPLKEGDEVSADDQDLLQEVMEESSEPELEEE